jgi:hypothetical protein
VGLSGISTPFEVLSQIIRQIIYALLTRAPLNEEQAPHSVRLACVRHAASVRSEPGSNSPVELLYKSELLKIFLLDKTRNLYTITAIRFSKTRSATKTDNLAKSVSAVNQKLFIRGNSL